MTKGVARCGRAGVRAGVREGVEEEIEEDEEMAGVGLRGVEKEEEEEEGGMRDGVGRAGVYPSFTGVATIVSLLLLNVSHKRNITKERRNIISNTFVVLGADPQIEQTSPINWSQFY